MISYFRPLINKFCPFFLRPHYDKICQSEIGIRLIKGSFWSIASALIARSISFAAGIIVARTLGKEGMGTLGIVNSTIGMFGVVAGFGIGITATKYVAELRQSAPTRAGRILGMTGMVTFGTGIVLALALAASANWLAVHSLGAPQVGSLLCISSIGLLFSTMNGAQDGALVGFEAFRSIAARKLAGALISLPVLVVAVLMDGIRGAIWAGVFSTFITWVLTHLAVRYECRRHHVPIRFDGCWSELPILWQFSLPAFLSNIVVVPVGWFCNTMLVRQPNGMGELGQYTVAMSFSSLIVTLAGFLGNPLSPMMANRRHTLSNNLQFFNLYATWGIASAICMIALVFPELLTLFYGSTFAGEKFHMATILVTLSTWIYTFKLSLNRVAIAHGTMWGALIADILRVSLLLCLTALLVPNRGAVGLAAAGFVSALTITIYFALYLLRAKRISSALLTHPCGWGTGLLIIAAATTGQFGLIPMAAKVFILIALEGGIGLIYAMTISPKRDSHQ